jgi:hypothetical protein
MAEVLGPFMSPYPIDEGPYPRSVLELRLLALSAAIRRKPDWHFERLDPEIVARWKEEAIAQHITPTQFQIVFDELECYDKLRSGCIEVADVDGVWKAPGLFPEDLASQSSRLVDHLSNVPDHEKDWHLGSDGTALDLIDPSLYLFVSGETRTVGVDCDPYTSGGNPTSLSCDGRVYKEPYEFTMADQYRSLEYQWIPTPIEVDDDKKVRFLSYVNNLHPKRHAQLYHVLAEMLTATIPLFEYVLGFLKEDRHPKIDLSGFVIYDPENPPNRRNEESFETYRERYEEYWETREPWEENWETRPMLPIPVEEYKPIQQIQPVSLRGRKLQIITKIQEIHLTPDKPSYEGGVWHIEGMENEGIVASAIYYYDCTNITECTLSFREAIREPDYEQYDNWGVEAVYGLVDEGPLVQELGSVVTKVFLISSPLNVSLVLY